MNNAVSFYPWRRLNSIRLPHQPSANVIITTSNQVTTLTTLRLAARSPMIATPTGLLTT
jgi:hypothetical protein